MQKDIGSMWFASVLSPYATIPRKLGRSNARVYSSRLSSAVVRFSFAHLSMRLESHEMYNIINSELFLLHQSQTFGVNQCYARATRTPPKALTYSEPARFQSNYLFHQFQQIFQESTKFFVFNRAVVILCERKNSFHSFPSLQFDWMRVIISFRQ